MSEQESNRHCFCRWRANMEIHSGLFVLTVEDDPTYSSGSTDNIRAYGREYAFCGDFLPTSKYGITCRGPGQLPSSCILLTAGGATSVNSHSVVVVGEHCFVGIGDMLCSLCLPAGTVVGEAGRFGHLFWSVPLARA